MWVKISDDLYAQRPDPDPVAVVSAVELQAELDKIAARLAELPEYPSDEELLIWAKSNYPNFHDTSVERAALADRLAQITEILSL